MNAVLRGEDIGVVADGFRVSQEEKAAWFQRILENRQHSLLQRRAHVDQHVPATDEIEPRKGRVLGQIVPREDAQIADGLLDLPAMVGPDEKTLQPRWRNSGARKSRG